MSSDKAYKVGTILENSLRQFTKVISVRRGVYGISGWSARKSAEKATVATKFVNRYGLKFAGAKVVTKGGSAKKSTAKASTSSKSANAPADKGSKSTATKTAPKSKAGKTAKTAAKKTAAKKTASKKSTAKKTTAKKSTRKGK